MKRPEEIPQSLVEEVCEATQEKWSALNHNLVREVLAVAWDAIWADGYTEGFQDQEGLEIQAEVLQKGGWAPQVYMWMDGATPDQAEELFDKVTDYAYDNEPDGVTLTMGAVLAPGRSHFPERSADSN